MLKTGVVLGKRYEILGRIGAGGMADVYKSLDHKLNRHVAVKVLKSTYRSDEVFIKKFLSEAQSAAGLMHPNVVNVYDVGEDRGLYYMVMELVEGITLHDYIEKKGRLSAKETISIAIQMVTGIQAAHNQHIIHRDIKPHNIIISKEGKVKVTDFGIARATTSTQTISTNVMGSVHYTSPEQARGGVVGERSDIYSAGVTMYEMVTGHVPFDGETTVEVAVKHIQEAFPNPSREVKDLPYSLECIIMKCTQKNTALRYKDCQELINDLKRSLLDPNGEFVHKSSPVRRTGGDTTVVMTTGELDRVNRRSVHKENYEDKPKISTVPHNNRRVQERDRGNNRQVKKNDVDPNTKQIMKILMIVAAVIIAFTVIYMVGNVAGVFKSFSKVVEEVEEQTVVPNVLGMTEAEAQKALNDADLGLDVVARKVSDKYDVGEIMEQSIAADTEINKYTTIEVVVSMGAEVEKIKVPDVRGMNEDKAKKVLEDDDFVVDVDYKFDSSVEESKVISTDPEHGEEVDKGSNITIYVSKGSEKVKVPNVVGESASSAQRILENADFKVSVTEEYSDKVSEGKVISQNPVGGKKAETGTTITIVVSLGPKEVLVKVPSLQGMSKSEAQNALSSAGLKANIVEQYNSNVTTGYVISQTVSGGSEVPEGTTITVYVSLGPEPSYEPEPVIPNESENTTIDQES
ncbi:MAG: Stk1 family PASTA domain-containing Ser/Thr kinase [Schaedlerella sp.]|nr:Stk1 family PASTA domain-containing Ser/Thr kinase [Schaedlerella sp.]